MIDGAELAAVVRESVRQALEEAGLAKLRPEKRCGVVGCRLPAAHLGFHEVDGPIVVDLDKGQR